MMAGALSRTASEATTLALARRRFETTFVQATLARNGGRRRATAASLGLTRQGLSKVIARLSIVDAEADQAPAMDQWYSHPVTPVNTGF
jgi:DNA-binding NtrC family response regulator